MKIERLVLGEMDTNVYLLIFEKEVFVIDPASDPEQILKAAKGLPITYVLLTHGHFDHCNAVAYLQKQGAKVFMSKLDYEMILNGFDLARFCGTHFNSFVPDVFIGEDKLNLNGHEIQVLSTPGHSAGSLTYIIEDMIFCGDTLFYLNVGRSDLPTGDKKQLTQSIKRLYELNDDAYVYPGHGKSTKLSFEKGNNPYVKAL